MAAYFTWQQTQRSSDLAIEQVLACTFGDLNRNKTDEDCDPTKEIKIVRGRQDYPFGAHLDLVFRNSGEVSALIKRVTLQVLRVTPLSICAKVGGEVESSATYDFAIKQPAPPAYDLSTTTIHSVDDKLDRITLLIQMSLNGGDPTLALVKVRLDTSEGPLTTGPVVIAANGPVYSLLRPTSTGWDVPADKGIDCVRQNATTINEFLGEADEEESNDQVLLLREEFDKFLSKAG
ncbi:hypothetical protein [Nonomuraea basaltis]|uniref:hypothetical protein n=1 Tax=Nonomuraea basaltis TaxID=2495887 RepID=UPI00110C4F0E|nr:hypothetical protein [Nonomuraea basaltis]TMR88136.1 hypothetical protein EJK15_67910 [Nonomuraea basaltis]